MEELYYIGLDLHKKIIAYWIKTASGVIVGRGTVAATRSALLSPAYWSTWRLGLRFPNWWDYAGVTSIDFPLVFLSIPPLTWLLIRFVRRRRFDRVGHCRQCGYDLTGNISGRCPECGTPTGQAKPR